MLRKLTEHDSQKFRDRRVQMDFYIADEDCLYCLSNIFNFIADKSIIRNTLQCSLSVSPAHFRNSY